MRPVKPAMPQSNYKKCSKSAETQSTYLWSVSKATRKQIGTQPEVPRDYQDSTSKCLYPSLSTNLCPDSVKMQSNHNPDSKSYMIQNHHMWSVNPGKMQSNHMQPVKADPKKSQVNKRSQVQASKCKRDTKLQA